MESITLIIPEQYPMTDDELFAFCTANKVLRIERNENGQLIVMSPTGSFTGKLNFKITSLFGQWVETNTASGYGFDSAAGFTLPDNSMRSPDVSWIKKERWDNIPLELQERFAPICPDFVIELRSKSDSLNELKLEQWIKNGCQLAWLIDPIEEKVYIYQPALPTEEVTGFENKLNGGSLLPEFELHLSKLK